LFKSKSFVEGETEMVVFITPTVMTKLDEGVNQAEVMRAQELVDRFENIKVNGLLD
jgi:Flp pilus assembly secretin CpaC